MINLAEEELFPILTEEMFPVVTEEDEVVGSAPRSAVHSRGLIHRSVFFFLFDQAGRVFVNQRSIHKKFYPEYWSILLGGHVRAGESYEEAVVREAKEEAGIESKPFFIAAYKKRLEGNDKENVKVYGFVLQGEPVLEERELKKGMFVGVGELEQFIAREKCLPETRDSYRILLDFFAGEKSRDLFGS